MSVEFEDKFFEDSIISLRRNILAWRLTPVQ